MSAKPAITILLFVLLLGRPLHAELWKCQDGSFTNLKPPAEKKCELLQGSTVCGAGKNRFISKGSSLNSDSDCSGETESSPFVNMKLVEAWQRDKAAKATQPKQKKVEPAPKPPSPEDASGIGSPKALMDKLLEMLK